MKCAKCEQDKPISEFRKAKKLNVYNGNCKECLKLQVRRKSTMPPDKYEQRLRANYERHLMKKYGLTLEAYQALLKKCSVCSSTENLCLDHDHITGAFRGVLCRSCNSGISFLYDSPRLIRRALAYVEKHQTKRPAHKGGQVHRAQS